MRISAYILIPVSLLALVASALNAQESGTSQQSEMGQFLGAKETAHPAWFKESFLDFEEDIAEATAQNKRLVLYFYQSGCPYCNKLVEENFADPVIADKVQTGFDLVAINMWGDREVVEVGGNVFTEKTLAAALNVNFTPTLLFFNEQKKVALRIDGYYPSAKFIHALNYVAEKKENQSSFSEYLAGLQQGKANGKLNSAEWLLNAPYSLDQLESGKPVAVLFEEPECETCDLLHQKTFSNPAALPLLSQFDVVQLNRWSDTTVTRPDGTQISAKDWATELDLGFSPAIVLFNADGEQIIVVDAMFKTFHILGVFDYVASQAYRSEPSFQRYLSARAEHIRSTGKDVDIWSY